MTATFKIPLAIRPQVLQPEHAVFIECIASRNNGQMHGFWVDLEFVQDADDWKAVTEFLFATSKQPNAEEYQITDHKIPQFAALAGSRAFIEFTQISCSLSSDLRPAYWAYCSHTNNVSSRSEFEAAFQGFYSDEAKFSEERQLLENNDLETYFLSNYVDWDRVWQGEYHCNGYFAHDVAGQVAIFAPVGK